MDGIAVSSPSFPGSKSQPEVEPALIMAQARTPKPVASTGETYCCTIAESRLRERRLGDAENSQSSAGRGFTDEDQEVNYFKSAQWSPDGTSILTSSADNTIRTFILPPNLLDVDAAISLAPYTTHIHPTPINCLAPYPKYSLSDPSTTLYISTPTALPIRLLNTLSPQSTPLSTHTLINPTTEAYQTPSSLLWHASSPNNFLAGTDCLIALFDVSRPGSGPTTRLPTIPSKRHKMKGGGVGMRGIISALSQQPSLEAADIGMLAAGTWTRWLGLYDFGGMGGTVATWSIADAADTLAGIRGGGVTQTGWSACGRYLFAVERKSKGVLVYDVRVTGKLVAWLQGREADTNQRLGVEFFPGKGGTEIWAGGTDGVVRVWEGVGMKGGALQRSWEWRAHDDPVTSTIVHPSGTVVATCSGQRAPIVRDGSNSNSSDENESSEDNFGDDSCDDCRSSASSKTSSRVPDNSMRVWSL